MSRLSALGTRLSAGAALVALCAAGAGAQQQTAAHADHNGHGKASLSRDEIAALAKVTVQINAARDSTNVQLSKSGNKTRSAQTQMQEKLREEIKLILLNGGMSEAVDQTSLGHMRHRE